MLFYQKDLKLKRSRSYTNIANSIILPNLTNNVIRIIRRTAIFDDIFIDHPEECLFFPDD